MKGLLAYKFLASDIPIVPHVKGRGSSALLVLAVLVTAFVIYLVVDAWMTWKRNRRLSKFFPHKQAKPKWWRVLFHHRRASLGVRK